MDREINRDMFHLSTPYLYHSPIFVRAANFVGKKYENIELPGAYTVLKNTRFHPLKTMSRSI